MAEDTGDLIKRVEGFLGENKQRNNELGLRTSLVRALEEQFVIRMQSYSGEEDLPPYTKIQKKSLTHNAFMVSSSILDDSLEGAGSKSISFIHFPGALVLYDRGLRKNGISATDNMLSVGQHRDSATEKVVTEEVKKIGSPSPQGEFSPRTTFVYDQNSNQYFKMISVPMGTEDSRPKVGGIMDHTENLLDKADLEDLGLMERALRALNGEVELGA